MIWHYFIVGFLHYLFGIHTHAHTDSNKFSVTYKYYLGFLKGTGQLHQFSHADDDDDDDDDFLLGDDC
jgi:hypothetical protein